MREKHYNCRLFGAVQCSAQCSQDIRNDELICPDRLRTDARETETQRPVLTSRFYNYLLCVCIRTTMCIYYIIYQTLLAPINTLWGFAGIRLGQQAVFGTGNGNGNGNGTILLPPIANAGVVREQQITQLSYHYFPVKQHVYLPRQARDTKIRETRDKQRRCVSAPFAPRTYIQ
jgi:hypothetical protein